MTSRRPRQDQTEVTQTAAPQGPGGIRHCHRQHFESAANCGAGTPPVVRRQPRPGALGLCQFGQQGLPDHPAVRDLGATLWKQTPGMTGDRVAQIFTGAGPESCSRLWRRNDKPCQWRFLGNWPDEVLARLRAERERASGRAPAPLRVNLWHQVRDGSQKGSRARSPALRPQPHRPPRTPRRPDVKQPRRSRSTPGVAQSRRPGGIDPDLATRRLPGGLSPITSQARPGPLLQLSETLTPPP